MPTADEYAAWIVKNADKKGTPDFETVAHAYSDARSKESAPSIWQNVKQGAGNLAAGALRGAGSIGATLMYPIDKATDMIQGDRGPTVESIISGKQPLSRNEERRAAMDDALAEMGAQPDSWAYKGGKLAGEIAGTAGAGGVVANGVRAVAPALAGAGMSAPTIQALANASRTGGFATGAAPGSISTLANIGTRVAGGAMSGGLSAAMVDPHEAGVGALVGGAAPPILGAAGKIAGYAGNAVHSFAQPFTNEGQTTIAGKIMNKFAQGGPTAVDSSEIIKGSMPTLAEATGNPGLSRMQSVLSDTTPTASNTFYARQAANNNARNAAFDDVAGDAGKLEFFRTSRADAAQELYNKALSADTSANMTPYIKGQITQLLKRPSINDARQTAQRWAEERGETASFDGSMKGLHDVKLALDDDISVAVRAGKGGQAKALQNTKDKLIDVMEKLSPDYKEARVTYEAMSKPVNQMEALQGLKLTDAKGNITLAKVQNALDGIENKMSAPGFSDAKSLTADQVNVLKSIRNDLLRKDSLNAGKSAGSNTLQNIATDNIMSTILPGKVGELAKNKLGGFAGQIGKLMYSGPNESIRNKLQEMALNPSLAPAAMKSGAAPVFPQAARSIQALKDAAGPSVYRGIPAIAAEEDR